jgi:predicted SnoaL-like aldol condensation-catalyzing enzyme
MSEVATPRLLVEHSRECAALEASQALVRRYFEMWNTGQWTEADAVLGPTYLDHAYPSVVGPAAVRSLVRRFRSENRDAHMSTEMVAFDSEYVVVRRAIRWTSQGEPEPCGIALFRIADGQLAEQWSWTHPARRTPGPGPREVWEQAHRHVRDYDVDGFADVLSVGGRLEGREEIPHLLTPPTWTARDADRRVTGYDPIVVHGTDDPEVIVIEFDLRGEDEAGKAYRLPYLQIARVRDGRLVVLRDYIDSRALADRLQPAPQ